MNETVLEVVENNDQNDDYADELSRSSNLDEQYLSFSLGDEIYSVDILSVQEIRTWEMPTMLPRSPEYMKGVLNLRGTIVPVIDLRLKFQICKPVYNETTVVIILRIEEQGRVRVMGIVVDAMSDVLFISKDDVRNSPEFGGQIDAEYIDGLTTIDGEVVSLLNTKALLNIDDIDHTVNN
ncbi:MAG: purine-binding chemotaxis protein CheW [Gammaproteobacteria bacterium]|nr:purine-binding chemotaxis protein CheW [Gammaproteobacteria bacterium]